MGSCREVLTFQLGNYSNYIGSHWWNIQESSFNYDPNLTSEICQDVLFREGKMPQGTVTFTPRVLVVDCKENLNFAPVLREEEDGGTFPEGVLLEQNQNPRKHEFQHDLDKIDRGEMVNVQGKDYQFSDSVTSWCDFMRSRYHPRSVLTSSGADITMFSSGSDIYNGIKDELIDRTRCYIEECDNVQGFQVVVDAVDAFGGLASSVLLHLEDEYSSKPRITFPTIPSYYANPSPPEDVTRTVNTLLTYQKLSEGSLVVPLCMNKTAWRGLGPPIEFPHLSYNHEVLYESSAVLAAFLDTFTLRYRLLSDKTCMYDVTSGLTFYSRPVAAASLMFPFPMAPKEYLLDTLEAMDDSVSPWQSVTPGCSIPLSSWLQNVSVRGISPGRLKDPTVTRPTSESSSCTTVRELFQMYLSFSSAAVSNVSAAVTPLHTAVPFPQLFSQHVSSLGSVDAASVRREGLAVNSASAVAGVHSCKEVGAMLESLHGATKKINKKRFHRLNESLDDDEYFNSLESLMNVRMCYSPSMDMEFQ